MYLTRAKSSKKWQIPRKGTKYLARPASHVKESVTVVAALRDMLRIARTASEVKKMIREKKIKINGREVKDYRETIKIFNLFEAGKIFSLWILPTKRFHFQEVQDKESKIRLCKLTGIKLIKSGKFQLNFHDGSNVLVKEKSDLGNIKVGDSMYLNLDGKISRHVPIEKGKEVFVYLGSNAGQKGRITKVDDKEASVMLSGREDEITLSTRRFVVL